MKRTLQLGACYRVVATCIATVAAIASLPQMSRAATLITAGDPVLSIDLDITTGSDVREAQLADFLLDGDTSTKMLNRGGMNAGIIVTPTASSIMQSFVITTANDSESRDPASYLLYGTNDAITSTEASNGREEAWTLISSGDLTLPTTRLTDGDPVGFTNTESYSSYKMVWPTIRGTGSLTQLSELSFFSSMDGTGSDLLTVGDPIISIRDVDYQYDSQTGSSSGTQEAAEGIDQIPTTKYLNFGKDNSGIIVTPSAGSSIVDSLQLTTANDATERDPASWILYGTNDLITSINNTDGNLEDWTMIDSGNIDLPTDRLTASDLIPVNNTAGAFTSYKLVFPTLRNSGSANSMQIGDIQLFGTTTVPEPSTTMLCLGALLSLIGCRYCRS